MISLSLELDIIQIKEEEDHKSDLTNLANHCLKEPLQSNQNPDFYQEVENKFKRIEESLDELKNLQKKSVSQQVDIIPLKKNLALETISLLYPTSVGNETLTLKNPVNKPVVISGNVCAIDEWKYEGFLKDNNFLKDPSFRIYIDECKEKRKYCNHPFSAECKKCVANEIVQDVDIRLITKNFIYSIGKSFWCDLCKKEIAKRKRYIEDHIKTNIHQNELEKLKEKTKGVYENRDSEAILHEISFADHQDPQTLNVYQQSQVYENILAEFKHLRGREIDPANLDSIYSNYKKMFGVKSGRIGKQIILLFQYLRLKKIAMNAENVELYFKIMKNHCRQTTLNYWRKTFNQYFFRPCRIPKLNYVKCEKQERRIISELEQNNILTKLKKENMVILRI